MSSLKKNVVGQNFTFALINASTGAGLTGATVSVFVTKDNGAQASGAGTVTEAGHGQYNYAPTQAETNATDVGFLMTAASAIPVNLDFHPDVVDANGLLQVDVVDWLGTVVATPATAGIPDVNVKNFGNTGVTGRDIGASVNVAAFGGVNVTGRDIGASVLLSSGTAAGQIALASGSVTVGTNADKVGYSLAAAEYVNIADGLLNRDMSLGTDSGSVSVRTPRQAFYALRNNIFISGSTMTVCKTDDATPSWTAVVTTNSAALPITGLNPT